MYAIGRRAQMSDAFGALHAQVSQRTTRLRSRLPGKGGVAAIGRPGLE
jgi:hypothetical protein